MKKVKKIFVLLGVGLVLGVAITVNGGGKLPPAYLDSSNSIQTY